MEHLVQSVYFDNKMTQKSSHYHDCYQIILVLSGAAQVCVNDAKYEAKGGSIMIFSRYEDHAVRLLSEQYERYVLRISPLAGQGIDPLFSLLSNRPKGFSHMLDVSDETGRYVQLFEELIREQNGEERMKEPMLELLVRRLLILLHRRTGRSVRMDAQDMSVIGHLQRRFEQDFAESYTLEALAKEYHISPSALSHRFKAVTGTSVMGYLLSCRMAAAKSYLSRSTLDIGQIVERCGFSDNSNFSRTFKKLSGLSPTDFRNKYRA